MVLHILKTIFSIYYISSFILFHNAKKIKENDFDTCETKKIKFDPVIVVQSIKFLSVICTIEAFRSENLLYINTPHRQVVFISESAEEVEASTSFPGSAL